MNSTEHRVAHAAESVHTGGKHWNSTLFIIFLCGENACPWTEVYTEKQTEQSKTDPLPHT